MAYYNLDDVRRAAKSGRIEYNGRRVGIDVAELGYQLNDVIRCLLAISSDEFHKSHQYQSVFYDAYVTSFPCPDREDQLDELYVKFALIGDFLSISLGSFHLQR